MKKGTGFLKSALALTCAFTLAGCGGNKSDNGEKVFRFAQSNPKQGLDMQKSTNAGSSSIADSVVEPLLKWTEDNELVTNLITKMPEVSDDGLTYSFELKEGVKFSDGTALDSNDVKYTFERMFNPKTAAKSTYMYDMIVGASDMLAGKATEISGIKVQDDRHFTITLEYPFAAFVNNMGINYADIFPSEACEKAGDNWGKGKDLIGTGPYKIESNDDNTKVVLVKNENYHGGTPKLDRIEVSYIDDNNTKLLEYEKGNIDACDLSGEYLKQYADSEYKDEIHYYTPLGTNFINLNLNDDALKDVRVREAISLAINRKELCETVLNGAAVPATSFLNPGVPGHDDSLKEYEYNPEKAKKLLKEAGKEGLTLTCKVRSGAKDEMVAIQGYLKKVGIDMKVEVMDNAVWSSAWGEGTLQVTTLGWYPLYADADNQMYTYFYSKNAAGKSSFYNNAKFDDLVTKARQTTDQAKRVDYYKEADKILSREDYATIPTYYKKSQFLAKPWVQNMKVGNLIYHFNDIDIDLSAKK